MGKQPSTFLVGLRDSKGDTSVNGAIKAIWPGDFRDEYFFFVDFIVLLGSGIVLFSYVEVLFPKIPVK